MSKSIELRLPAWANWIAQDEYNGEIWVFENEPQINNHYVVCSPYGRHAGICKTFCNTTAIKINLSTHAAFIDEDGILQKCKLLPDMLKEQA